MRRFLMGLALFCLLCGGGLMLIGNRCGADHSIQMTTDDGRKVTVALFDLGVTGIDREPRETGRELPDTPNAAPLPNGLERQTITELELYSYAGEVVVQRGATWNVTTGEFGGCEVTDGVLHATADTDDLVVTVPEDTVLDRIQVTSDFGDVTLEDLQTESLSIRQSCGEMILRRCSWATAELQNDAGSVSGTDVSSGGLDLMLSAGDVELQGQLTGKTDIENDLGAVTLTLEEPETAYGGRLETDLGEVTVGRRSDGTVRNLGGGPHELEVYCDLGSIEVHFSAE